MPEGRWLGEHFTEFHEHLNSTGREWGKIYIIVKDFMGNQRGSMVKYFWENLHTV